jgi:hypothetical protein
MFKKLWNWKAVVLAFEIAFIFCFFVGIFYNPPIITKLYDIKHQFYINRGYPVAWAGTSAINKAVEFPIIKAPFLMMKSWADESKWSKIIDLRIFIPLFMTALLISYTASFPFAKASEENKNLNFILFPTYFILLIGCIFFYFFWFSRI